LAGIGITLQYTGAPILASFSVPVQATDVTRCEALGPALASLLVARLPGGPLLFQGDSFTVVRLLRKEFFPTDIWLYNATQIALDMVKGRPVEVKWIPRA
jgi:hypothetical protein